MARERMTRRRFLAKAAAAAAGLGILGLGAQCGPTPTPEVIKEVVEKEVTKVVEKVVTKEVVKEVPKEVTKIVEKVVEVAPVGPKTIKLIVASWIGQKLGFFTCLADWNSKNPDVQFVADEVPGGEVETKVLGMIRDKNLIWGGQVAITASTLPRYIFTKMIQPIGDYVAASNVLTDAEAWYDDWVDPCYVQQAMTGEIWGIPMNLECGLLSYRVDYLKGAGWDKPPETWEEVLECGMAVLQKYGGENVVPMGVALKNFVNAQQGIMHSFQEDIYREEDGLVDVTGPGMKKMLEMYDTWYEAGITPKPFYAEVGSLWEKGKLAMYMHKSSRVPWAQAIWGKEAIGGAAMPRPKDLSAPGRTSWWSYFVPLFTDAPYPQETIDFYLTIFNPDNDVWNKGLLGYGHLIPFKSPWERVVDPDGPLGYLYDAKDQVVNSQAPRLDNLGGITQDMLVPWLEKYLERPQKYAIEEAMEAALKDIRTEAEKQRVTIPLVPVER